MKKRKKNNRQAAPFFARNTDGMAWLPVAYGSLAYFLPFVFYGFKLWMDENFGGAGTVEMIAVFLMFGPSALAGGPSEFIINGVILMVLWPLAISLLASGLDQWLLWLFKKAASNASEIKKIYQRYKIIKSVVVVGWFVLVGSILWHALNGNEFVKMHNKSSADQPDYFQQHYVDPKNIAITPPARKKNLVLVYVESLEDNFKDPAFFGRNLMASMKPMEQKGFLFNLHTAGTAVETLPGHVASQCGLPLKSTFFTNIDNARGEPAVLQNAICLSDILAKHGYYNVFMQAATRYTGGIGYFYGNHHFNEAKSLEYWQTHGYGIGESDKKGPWGLFDKVIFDEGYKKLQALQAQRQNTDQPFFLIIATIDIHAPVASPCTRGQQPQQFDQVVECTSLAIAQFVADADKNGLLKNTELYMMGDHRIVSVSGVDMEKWNKAYPKREPYSFLYGKDITPKRRDITHYDVLPTLLELLGFSVAGHRLGFGYSALAEFPNYPSLDQWHSIMAQAAEPSTKYLSLWGLSDASFKQYMGNVQEPYPEQ
ncbi:MAG: LTA synthase family protein [Hydrotalea sp.]|nr:LTA synthase family protein [Hydrotalea sp.]